MTASWIEFSIKSPEPDQKVFYFFKFTGVSVGRFAPPETFFGKSGFLTGDVSHWMPLPSVPDEVLNISESKPADRLKVAVFSSAKDALVATYVADLDTFFDNRGGLVTDVAFWVPLPDPPSYLYFS